MSDYGLTIADALRGGVENLRAHVLDQVTDGIKKTAGPVMVSNASIQTALEQAIDKALSVKVVDVIAGGWKRWDDLRQKAVKSREDDARYVVPLVEHAIDVVYEPSIELVVNEIPLAKIVLTFDLSLSLSGFRVTLRHGAVTCIDAGECSSSGKLGVAGKTLWGGPLGHITLPAHWDIDPPLALDGIAGSQNPRT
jgi:hypothetical protein